MRWKKSECSRVRSRGAKYSDHVQYLNSIKRRFPVMTDGSAGIFISYTQEDTNTWVCFVGEEVSEAFGEERVSIDLDTLRSGSWREQIDEALNRSGVVLVVIGRHWLTITDETGLPRLTRSDDVHRQEIALALARKGVTVIP